MLSVIGPSSVSRSCGCSAAAVEGPARAFPAAPQLGAQQAGDRVEQAACQVVQVEVATLWHGVTRTSAGPPGGGAPLGRAGAARDGGGA
ncbi:hypothetical protein EH183_43010 [Streptomyces sp. CB01881]|nr:hypothetical protein EH183_43010 [Streptomyces sp. CB01881]